MKDLLKFPPTPHLFWLAPGSPRADKVLSEKETAAFLDGEILVEEKIDGANVGISLDADGRVRVQSRGEYLGPGAQAQFEPLWAWLEARGPAFTEHLSGGLVVFGEWCFATHSVCYDRLPDWFLGFDVFAAATACFWSSRRRTELFRKLEIVTVPELARGRFLGQELLQLLGPSRLGKVPMEGLYVRREEADRLLGRAKVVRPAFLQAIDDHWMKREFRKNLLGAFEGTA